MRSVDPAPEPRQSSTNRTGSDFIGAWRRGPIAASFGPPAGVRHPGGARAAATSSVAYDHYSVLRTIEDNWGLAELGNASCSCTRPMTDLLAP